MTGRDDVLLEKQFTTGIHQSRANSALLFLYIYFLIYVLHYSKNIQYRPIWLSASSLFLCYAVVTESDENTAVPLSERNL